MVTGCVAQFGAAAAAVGQAAAVFWLFVVDVRYLSIRWGGSGGRRSADRNRQEEHRGTLWFSRPVVVLFTGAHLVVTRSHAAFWVLVTLVLWSSLEAMRRIAERYRTEHEALNEHPLPERAKALALLWVLLTRGLPVWLLWEMLRVAAP